MFSNQTVISAKYKTHPFHRIKFLTRWSNASTWFSKSQMTSSHAWMSRWKTTQCVMMGKERPRREVPPKLHPGKSLSFREFLIPTLLTHSFHYSKSNSCNWSRTQVPCSGLVWCHVYLFLTKMKLFFRVKLFLGMKLFWYKGETVCQDVIIQICGCQ